MSANKFWTKFCSETEEKDFKVSYYDNYLLLLKIFCNLEMYVNKKNAQKQPSSYLLYEPNTYCTYAEKLL
jgi:hypothetical protein